MAHRDFVAIMISIDYGDYLSWTLPRNSDKFDRVFVVTTQDDGLTRSVCETTEKATVLLTDRLHANGAAFNKSAMLRGAQQIVHEACPAAWIALLDADILLPEDLRGYDLSGLDPRRLYGIERLDYRTPLDWKNASGEAYPYATAGYFQLYFDKTKLYPPSSFDCTVCDIKFHDLFEQPSMLPGCGPASHLGPASLNHRGRRSEGWPERSPDAALDASGSAQSKTPRARWSPPEVRPSEPQ